MRDDVPKILVAGQHRQLAAYTYLGQERVDRADLDAATTAPVSQIGSFNVIVAVGNRMRGGRTPAAPLAVS
jgi:hypothetical protein